MSEILPSSECPDAATLRALLDGTLSDDQQAATQAHVDRCPTCEAALRQMTAGGESWIGMAEKLKSGGGDDPKLTAALERLKADDGSGGESSTPEADPQRTLDFLQPADDPKLLGKLGQHEISEVVGWGGMGVVLKAYDPSLHRVVAVKVLASHLAHHAVARKRFIREAQAAAAVCHDNVVTIHAIDEAKFVVPPLGGQNGKENFPPEGGTTNALPKIVMQFVAGGSLQERIDQEAPLELKEILRIAMQTAAGLAAAHAQGVVHRDVKPANILLENGVQRVKLTDFGLARVMDDASLTLSGVIAGTPQYMAPEQAWGRDVDARADLFSLGAVLYAMCSGHSPFRARTTMAVLKRVCEDAPRPLRAINPDIPEWLVAIIEKLLAKNPDERFQSATEISELLANWLAHVQQPTVVPAPEVIAWRGSPDPATLRDRRSPGESIDGQSGGEPRSKPGAGTGDPRPARGGITNESTSQLSPKIVVVAMVVVGVLLGFLSISVIERNPRNLDSFLAFSAVQMLATFAMASAFRAAWNTSRWVTFIAVLFFLPFLASLFGYLVSNRDASGAMQLVGGLQALTALAYECVLLFVRPLFPSPLNAPKPERSTGRRRFITAVSIVLVALSASFLLIWIKARATVERDFFRPQYQIVQPQLDDARNRDPRDSAEPLGTQPFPKPSLLSTGPGMATGSMSLPGTEPPTTTPEVLKPLLGRWVVVSVEGASLNPLSNNPTGTVIGGASFGMSAGGDMMMAGGMAGMPGLGPASGQSVPLQWIEFAADHVVVFDGRQAMSFAEFNEEAEPKQITLRDQPNPLSVGAIVWRRGIFRLDRDRLIICWTTGDRLPPTEFVTEDHYAAQLLILRREWNPPPVLSPPGESPPPPPRATIPFTTDEAKRYQEAWARSADVPIETTNSLGMKLRLIPAGAFDPAGAGNFEPFPMLSMTPPIYLSAHEVTVAQFRKFVEATKYETTAEQHPTESNTELRSWQHPGIVQDGDQHPVVCVSWQDANAFCRWLSDTEQQQYRLPSIAEWAFAARVGVASSTPLKLPHNARLRFFDTTAPVGGAHANLFGLHDLFGNVGEWANDNLEEQGFVMTFHRAALGGGYRSKRKPDTGIEWLLPQLLEPSEYLDDVGFRVARVIHRDAENLSGSLPPIEKLFASSAQVTILVNPDRAKVSREKLAKPDGDDKPLDSKKSDDPNAKLESGEWKPSTGPVVALRGLVPVGRFPSSLNIVDFEVERASGGQVNPNFAAANPDMNALPWTKINLQKTLDLLDQADFVTDTVPSRLTDSIFTMPLVFRSDSPWGELGTHPLLPKVEPSSKYAVEFRLFRYFDFDVAKDQRLAYRVRLKLASPKDSTDKNGLFTPWALTEQWVTIP